MPKKGIITAYHSLFMSQCSYALLGWSHSPHVKRIFGLQRKVIRIMTNLRYQDDVKYKFSRLKLLTLTSLYIYLCIMYAKENLTKYECFSRIH